MLKGLNMSDDNNPAVPPMPFGLYNPGRRAAARKLEELSCDPLSKIVGLVNKLEQEIAFQELRRAGKAVDLTVTGKKRFYNEEAHFALYDKLLRTHLELLKYVHIPASKEDDEPDKPQKYVLEIGLSGQDEPFIIGEEEETEIEDAVVVSDESKEILKKTQATIYESES